MNRVGESEGDMVELNLCKTCHTLASKFMLKNVFVLATNRRRSHFRSAHHHLCRHHRHCQLDDLQRQYNVHADHDEEYETIFWSMQSCTQTLTQVICKVSCNIVCKFYFCNLQIHKIGRIIAIFVVKKQSYTLSFT